MKKAFLILGIFIFSSTLFGQKIHTAGEIFKIMEASPVSYELYELKDEIQAPDRSKKLNTHDSYRVVEDGKIYSKKYNLSEEAIGYFSKAEEYFSAEKYQEARDMYLKVLEADSTCYQVMTYVGQTYEIENDLDNAIKWYEKTVELNYIDYMAHWFLADAYKDKGRLEKALNEITIAQILNRNNFRIKDALVKIYKLNKLDYPDWVFNPQYKIDSTGVDKVKISFNNDWLGYAMVKAVWLYEPGYVESMGEQSNYFSILQEKECFACLIPGFNKKKLRKHPEFKALQSALDNKMITEYIVYEILLLDYPHTAYMLSEELINDVKDYIIKVRSASL